MKKRIEAFTFIELLIALAIFSIIATCIYYTLHGGTQMWSRANSMIRENQTLRIFFKTISQDMRNAVYDVGVETGFSIESEWDTDRVIFPTIINISDGNKTRGELVKATYYFDKSEEELIRKCAGTNEKFDLEVAEKNVLLERLKDFSLQYAYQVASFEDEYEWKDTWDVKGEIPRGVRIKVTLKDENTQALETFEETVLIPIGKLGGEE